MARLNDALRRVSHQSAADPWPGACFSEVPNHFEPISCATIPSISSQQRGSKPSNFAILLLFLTSKTC